MLKMTHLLLTQVILCPIYIFGALAIVKSDSHLEGLQASVFVMLPIVCLSNIAAAGKVLDNGRMAAFAAMLAVPVRCVIFGLFVHHFLCVIAATMLLHVFRTMPFGAKAFVFANFAISSLSLATMFFGARERVTGGTK